MAYQLKLRFARPDEAEQIVDWLHDGKSAATNEFNAEILKYPTLQILCSYYDGSGPVAYVPKHTVTMLESTAIKPGLTDIEAAKALRDCVKGTLLLSSGVGIKEVYFLATDERLAKMAEGNGFVKLPWPIMRMKL